MSNVVAVTCKVRSSKDCTKKERLQKVSENLEASKKRNADIQKKMGGLKSSDWRTNLKEKLDSDNSQS